jgi:hypothetical protein
MNTMLLVKGDLKLAQVVIATDANAAVKRDSDVLALTS